MESLRDTDVDHSQVLSSAYRPRLTDGRLAPDSHRNPGPLEHHTHAVTTGVITGALSLCRRNPLLRGQRGADIPTRCGHSAAGSTPAKGLAIPPLPRKLTGGPGWM